MHKGKLTNINPPPRITTEPEQDFPITMKGIITFSDYLEPGSLINPTT